MGEETLRIEEIIMNKKNRNLNEFWAALIAGAAGGSLGTFISDLLDLNWILLGLLVAIIFLAVNRLTLYIINKDKS